MYRGSGAKACEASTKKANAPVRTEGSNDKIWMIKRCVPKSEAITISNIKEGETYARVMKHVVVGTLAWT